MITGEVYECAQEMPAVTPARRHTTVENLTFSTPSGHLYEDMEHSLWSESFTSGRGAMQVSAAPFLVMIM